MSLSVVIPAFNDRDHLTACLDALAARATGIETIVVNGPSTDGTSGMVHDRSDVDVLLESASRNLNVARNAGILAASRPVVALLAPAYRIQGDWQATIEKHLSGPADAASGPVRTVAGAADGEDAGSPGSNLAIHGGNLAMTRGALTALDGFDEYLPIDGTDDLVARIGGLGLHVIWDPDMGVQLNVTTDGGEEGRPGTGRGAAWQRAADADWGVHYRSLTYREVKRGGIRPGVAWRLLRSSVRDGATAFREVLRGRGTPSEWVGNGVDVLRNVAVGTAAGVRARRADRTPARNPNGLSQSRSTEAIEDTHDWR